MYEDIEHIDDNGENPKLKVLGRIRDRVASWYSYFNDNYYQGRADKYFLLVDQWTPEEREALLRLGVPILTINKLYDYVKKVQGQAFQMSPNIQVRALNQVTGDNTSHNLDLQKMIDLRTNMIRHIAYSSKSNNAYKVAFKNSTEMGYGAIRVNVTHESDKSFNQEIKIEAVNDPERTLFDPTAIEKTKEDGDYCGVYYTMTREEFDRLYPDAPPPASFPQETYLNYFNWGDRDTVTVVDYYEKDYYNKEIYQLTNGQVVDDVELGKVKAAYEEQNLPAPKIDKRRQVETYRIIHYRVTYNEILECGEFPGPCLPVVFVDGDSFRLDARQYTQSFIRHSIDTQRALNYTQVSIMQAIKNARREPYLVTPDNIRGYEKFWENPEQVLGGLPYNPDRKTGSPPIKQSATEVAQSLFQQYQNCTTDIQQVLGLYDANLGNPAEQASGIAIANTIKQGNTGTFVYHDNLNAAVEQTGRIVLKMMPTVYDTERIIALMMKDGTSSNVIINQMTPNNSIANNMKEGDFEIAIDIGPTFAQQKQAELELFMRLLGIMPQAAPLVADLVADNFDVENRLELVERFKTILPPNIQAIASGEPPPPASAMPQQPNPEMIMQQQEQEYKQQELALKQQQVQNERARIAMEARQNMTQAALDNSKNITDYHTNLIKSSAELRKAELDYTNKLAEMMNNRAERAVHHPGLFQPT